MEEKNTGRGLLVGGLGGTAMGTVIGFLLAGRPGEAAPPEAQWNYLIECQLAIIRLLEDLITAVGGISIAPPGIEVTVKTPWVAKDPEQIYSHAIRAIGTFHSDVMVAYTEGKRLVFVVQSSLNQAINIQVIGNYVADTNRATDINGVIPCPANSNISIGLAWDDWQPFIGVRITTAIAPTAGILNIWAVIQE